MGKFLIEVPYDASEVSCTKVVQIFYATGSHFLARAEWGCKNGEHCAWLLVEVEDEKQARQILPAAFRSNARIVALKRWTREEMDQLAHAHLLKMSSAS
jgi:hypothetical protein